MSRREPRSAPEIRTPVILIGAKGVGKSTQAFALAKQLAIPQVSLDGLAAELYRRDELFCSAADEASPVQDAGAVLANTMAVLEQRLGKAFYDYEEGLHLQTVREALARFGERSCLMDFGAGHTAYTSDERRRELAGMLRPHRPVVLLQPFADLARSVEYLYSMQRDGRRLTKAEIRYELALPGNEDLATHTIYTGLKSRKQVSRELVNVVSSL